MRRGKTPKEKISLIEDRALFKRGGKAKLNFILLNSSILIISREMRIETRNALYKGG